jgi:hypothetical protein
MQARWRQRAVSAQARRRSTEGGPAAMADEVLRALSSTPFSAILILQFAAEAPDAGCAE